METQKTASARETFLIEYYTTDGMIHFAWILRASGHADAREQVKRLRNFDQVITCDREDLCPLAATDPKVIHIVR